MHVEFPYNWAFVDDIEPFLERYIVTCTVPYDWSSVYASCFHCIDPLHMTIGLGHCIPIGWVIALCPRRIGPIKVWVQCTLAQHTVYTWQRITLCFHLNMGKDLSSYTLTLSFCGR